MVYAPPDSPLRLALTLKGLTEEEIDAFIHFLQNIEPTGDPLADKIRFPTAEMKKAWRRAMAKLQSP